MYSINFYKSKSSIGFLSWLNPFIGQVSGVAMLLVFKIAIFAVKSRLKFEKDIRPSLKVILAALNIPAWRL